MKRLASWAVLGLALVPLAACQAGQGARVSVTPKAPGSAGLLPPGALPSATLIGNDGAGLIGNDGAGLIANDGGSFSFPGAEAVVGLDAGSPGLTLGSPEVLSPLGSVVVPGPAPVGGQPSAGAAVNAQLSSLVVLAPSALRASPKVAFQLLALPPGYEAVPGAVVEVKLRSGIATAPTKANAQGQVALSRVPLGTRFFAHGFGPDGKQWTFSAYAFEDASQVQVCPGSTLAQARWDQLGGSAPTYAKFRAHADALCKALEGLGQSGIRALPWRDATALAKQAELLGQKDPSLAQSEAALGLGVATSTP